MGWYLGTNEKDKERVSKVLFPQGYSPFNTKQNCQYNPALAERAVQFIETFVQHVRGFTGKLTLEPWQRDIIETIFGWVRLDNTRRYREVFLEVARKNGKSLMSCAIALYAGYADGEPGAEVILVANDREHAKDILFTPLRYQVESSPSLQKRSEVFASSIVIPATASAIKVISSKPKHGSNPSCVIFDELHQQPNDELWTALKSGMGARNQPLWISTTTAGVYSKTSLCWRRHDYASRVADGTIKDPYFLPILYFAPKETDWTKPATWKLANPNLGVSIKPESLAEDCEKARQIPSEENNFRRYNLCQWVGSADKWLSSTAWANCGKQPLPDLEGRSCYAGLDLASKIDLSALVLVFPLDDGEYAVIPYFWVPENGAIRRANKDHVPYPQWIKEGYLTATPGDTTDYEYIRQAVNELRNRYNIIELVCDQWNCTQLANQLIGDGFDVAYFCARGKIVQRPLQGT